MSKTTKIVLACVAAFFLQCCGGGTALILGGFQGYKNFSKVVVPEGDRVVSDVCRTWDTKALKSRGSAMLQAIPDQETEALLKVWKSEYGAFQSGFGKMTGIHTQTTTANGSSTTATYVNDATFEKGDARVVIEFSRRGTGPWLVDSFKVTK